MALIATEQQRYSNVVKWELAPEVGYSKEVVTVNDAAATFPIGTVLGKVTASGKYKKVTVAASDGSQNAVAVVVGDASGKAADVAIPATTDTKVTVLSSSAIVSKDLLVLGADVTTNAQKQAVYDSLKSVGIKVTAQV